MNEQPTDPQQNRSVPPGPSGEGQGVPSATPPRVVGAEETAPLNTPLNNAPNTRGPAQPAYPAQPAQPAQPGLDETAVRPPIADPIAEQTAVLGAPWAASQGVPAGATAFGTPTPSPAATPKKRRGAGVAVVVASLLLGGAAGFGGAAAFHALDDDSSSSNGTQVSNVIDQGKSAAGEGSVEAVAAKVLPSVVQIEVSSSSASGSGSGIILSSDGLILTNDHVVDGAGENATLRVAFADGTRADAKVLGTDPLTDTAVIKAEGVSGLTPATIGKSSNLKVGQQVVAIGAPYGLDATVTSGIVSALDRPVNVGSTGTQGNSTTYPAIQTDAAINPGNSGGPLVDMTGSVIGINSSIRTAGTSSSGEAGSIGLGFAIPMDPMMPIVEQMSNGQTPTHARLGITVSDPQDSSSDIGALVREVGDDSAAGKAGLEANDLVTKVDDHTIDGADDLVATVRTYRPGDKATLTFLRNGKEQSVEITLDSDEGTTTSQDEGSQQGQDGQQGGQGQQQDGQGDPQQDGQGGLGGFGGFDFGR